MLVTWTEEAQGLDLSGSSILGSIEGQPSLVILPGVLQPGLTYIFQLNARCMSSSIPVLTTVQRAQLAGRVDSGVP